MNFITNNNCTTTTGDLTKLFQGVLRKIINEFKIIMHNDDKWKYVNLNPSPPKIRGTIKIKKNDSSIRPTVNSTNAPTYKLVELLSKNMKHTFISHKLST
jgi:hypothetical protein